MEKSQKILTLSCIILAGFFISAAVFYYLGGTFKLEYPYNNFLYPPDMSFSDFIELLPKIKTLHPYAPPSDWQNYFPLTFIFILPFAYFKNLALAYFVFAGIFLTFFMYFNVKNFSCTDLNRLQNFQNIFIITFLSYPVICLVDRGNLDMLIFLFFAAFVYLFQKEKYEYSAIILAIINAMKPFSFLFPILFLFKKRYREFFLYLGTTFILIIGGFLFFKGNIFDQMIVLMKSWTILARDFIYSTANNYGMSHQSTLYMPLKLIFCKLSTPFKISTFTLMKYYNILSFLITVAVAFFAYKEKSYWKQIALLTLCIILIPAISIDYKLVFLYVPVWLFVNAKEKSRFDLAYTILFGLLFIPKHIIFEFSQYFWFSSSIILNPLIIISIMALIIIEQFLSAKTQKKEQE